MISYKIRQHVLERYNNTCQKCGIKSEIGLHLHHLISKKKGGPNTLDNLTTLCPSCHRVLECGQNSEYIPSIDGKVDFRAGYTEMGNKLIIIVPKNYHKDIKKMKKPVHVIVEELDE